VTGSAKTGLIAHDRKFNFLSQTQKHINTLSSFTPKMKKSLGWSASAGCFFPGHWKSVRVVWVHHGALVEGRGLSVTVKLCGAE